MKRQKKQDTDASGNVLLKDRSNNISTKKSEHNMPGYHGEYLYLRVMEANMNVHLSVYRNEESVSLSQNTN